MSAFRPRQGEPNPALTWTAIVVALGVALAFVAAFGGPKNVRRTTGGNIAFAIGAAARSKRRPSRAVSSPTRISTRP